MTQEISLDAVLASFAMFGFPSNASLKLEAHKIA